MKNNQKTVFTGACTALITPFRDGKIDFFSLKKLIELQIQAGIDALLVCGTTGESATLSDTEKRELISFAVREVAGRVPVIAGTGSNDTRRAIALSEFASSVGANALLIVTPYYNKATAQGLIKHFGTIADSVETPIILYNVPSRTGVNIPLEAYEDLLKYENIIALKEASANMSYLANIASKYGNILDIYSGNDDLILPTLSLGGKGVISVLSNALPKETSEICNLWLEGKTKEATALQLKLLPLINALFSEVNPIPIKALLSYMGICHEEYRLPLCKMNPNLKNELFEKYKSI